MDQALLIATTIPALWLIQDEREEYKRFACFFGIASQFVFFYISIKTNQWALASLCFVYGALWLRSFKQYWMANKWQTKSAS